MPDSRHLLKKNYETSRALIIGINKYKNTAPLGYAVSDATAIRKILIDALGFYAKNIITLLDEEAVKKQYPQSIPLIYIR